MVPTDSEKRLRILNPSRVAVLGLAAWGAAFMIAPVQVAIPISYPALGYIAACYVCFVLGSSLLAPLVLGLERPTQSRRVYYPSSWLVTLIIIVAIIGVGLKFADRFVFRHVSLMASAVDRRQSLETTNPTGFSAIAAAVYPFCLVPYFLQLGKESTGAKRNFVLYWGSLALFFYPAFDALSVASRSLVLVNVLLLFLYHLYFGVRFTRRFVLVSVVTIFGLAVLFVAVLFSRLDAEGVSPAFASRLSAYAFTLKPADWINPYLLSQTHWISYLAFTFLNLSQYFLHGIFEFGVLYEHYFAEHTWGADMFEVYFKLFAMVGGGSHFTGIVAAVKPRSGTFTGFFGDLFIDAGWYGPVVMLIFGFIMKTMTVQACYGRLSAVPLWLFLTIVVVMFPVMNLVANAQGLYFISGLGAVGLLCWVDAQLLQGGQEFSLEGSPVFGTGAV